MRSFLIAMKVERRMRVEIQEMQAIVRSMVVRVLIWACVNAIIGRTVVWGVEVKVIDVGEGGLSF